MTATPVEDPAPQLLANGWTMEQWRKALENKDAAAIEEATKRHYINLLGLQKAKAQIEESAFVPPSDLDWDSVLLEDEDNWLIPGLIGLNSVNLLVAKSTIGKTFLSISMICAGATNTTWANRTFKPFRTLVYLSEGKRNYARRLLAWAEANEQNLDAIKDNILIKGGMQLRNPKYLEHVRQTVQDFQPDLVIFDTFSGTSGVTDENDAAEVAGVLESTRMAAEPASVLFIHHPNKASEKGNNLDTRGSGTLRNNVDTVMIMHAMDKRSLANTDTLVLSTDPKHGGKVKDAAPITIPGFYLEGVDLQTSSGGSISSAVMRWARHTKKDSAADKAVKQYLSKTPMSAADFMTAAGISRASAYRQLKESPYAKVLEDGNWILLTDDEVLLEELDETFIDDDTQNIASVTPIRKAEPTHD